MSAQQSLWAPGSQHVLRLNTDTLVYYHFAVCRTLPGRLMLHPASEISWKRAR